MIEGIEIRGGAGEAEAAVIAVVIDRIAKEEQAARQGRGRRQRSGLPAWVRAVMPDEHRLPWETVHPD